MIQTSQRVLRRRYLLDNLTSVLRESAYHRLFEDEENLSFQVLYTLGDEEGGLPIR